MIGGADEFKSGILEKNRSEAQDCGLTRRLQAEMSKYEVCKQNMFNRTIRVRLFDRLYWKERRQ